MTTAQLKEKVSFFFAGYGHYKVTITYRGKEYNCTSTDTLAVDSIGFDGHRSDRYYKTDKQALMALYNECKRANNLR